ncbi:sugar phosphate isomerase/epimerase family protein [Cohnella sp.]|uniref:sugar phosphate isomerase/epimerase family protein n=1 Tax=Cohnella sp. TaxID=1883426 RepID=UPI003566999F
MQIGILAHLLGQLPYDQLASKVADHGIRHVQLALWKAISGYDFTKPGCLSTGLAGTIGEAFDKRGVSISVLGCYLHLFDRDVEQRRLNIERFKELLRHARDFGSSIVAAETGSPWHGVYSDEEWNVLRSTIEELAEEAEKWGVYVGLEAAGGHLIDTSAALNRMLEEVPSARIGVVMDPGNLLTPTNFVRQDEVIEEAFRLLGDRVIAGHAKDRFLSLDGQLLVGAAGTGQMNYKLYTQLIKKYCPDIPLIMEEAGEGQIMAAKGFLEDLR